MHGNMAWSLVFKSMSDRLMLVRDAMRGNMAYNLVFEPMSDWLTQFIRFDCCLMQPTS